MNPQSRSDRQDKQTGLLALHAEDWADRRKDLRISFARSPAALHSCFRDGVSIINLSAGTYFRLEAIGFRIWMILARPSTIEEIKADLIADGTTDPDSADTTIMAFVDSLKEAGLVVAV